MEGRQIQNNLRKTVDVISHIYQSGKQMIIVSIDFEKCFYCIEHNSLFAAMQYFNIGEKYIQWISSFYNQFQVCMQNAGFLSSLFPKTRGCNQGCNMSPFCYIICREIMSHLIKGNPDIRGIKMS